MRTIQLTARQIARCPNKDWAKPDDDVFVSVYSLPNAADRNPAVQYEINGEIADSQESWVNIPATWQRGLRAAPET